MKSLNDRHFGEEYEKIKDDLPIHYDAGLKDEDGCDEPLCGRATIYMRWTKNVEEITCSRCMLRIKCENCEYCTEEESVDGVVKICVEEIAAHFHGHVHGTPFLIPNPPICERFSLSDERFKELQEDVWI
jgi:hypothetical protein